MDLEQDALAMTIMFLRPINTETRDTMCRDGNGVYLRRVPPPRQTAYDGDSCHSTPNRGSPWTVLRLGFDSSENPSARGFVFGGGRDADVELRAWSGYSWRANSACFRVYYNFDSGALMIEPAVPFEVGGHIVRAGESRLLEAGTSLRFRGNLGFTVELPDVGGLEQRRKHEKNYLLYAAGLGFVNAKYLPRRESDAGLVGDKYMLWRGLGSGGSGIVTQAVDMNNGAVVAIKAIVSAYDATKEIRVMKRLQHENIIKHHHEFEEHGTFHIVMECAVNDLEGLRSMQLRGYFPPTYVRLIAQQVLSALKYIHAKGIIHRDVKPENILVTSWDPRNRAITVKLADFGIAGTRARHYSMVGTRGYQPPEMRGPVQRRARARYNSSVDIWAMGTVLGELLGDVPSYEHESSEDERLSDALIEDMRQRDPGRRPTATECLEGPWLNTYDSPES